MKSSLVSILVVLGACDRAAVDSPRASPVAGPSAERTVATASSSVTMPTRALPSASSSARPTNDHPTPTAMSTRPREAPKTSYACPMHPEVTSDGPGLCPKCNMKLEPKTPRAEIRLAPAAPGAPL